MENTASSPGTFHLKATFAVTKADVLYQNTKKPAVKTAGGTMRCARTSTSKVPTEFDFWLVYNIYNYKGPMTSSTHDDDFEIKSKYYSV